MLSVEIDQRTENKWQHTFLLKMHKINSFSAYYATISGFMVRNIIFFIFNLWIRLGTRSNLIPKIWITAERDFWNVTKPFCVTWCNSLCTPLAQDLWYYIKIIPNRLPRWKLSALLFHKFMESKFCFTVQYSKDYNVCVCMCEIIIQYRLN